MRVHAEDYPGQMFKLVPAQQVSNVDLFGGLDRVLHGKEGDNHAKPPEVQALYWIDHQNSR